MPGKRKHLLIETKDGGDDTKGVTETKSKIPQHYSLQTWLKLKKKDYNFSSIIETEAGGDDTKGVAKPKSKILHYHYQVPL